MFNKDNSSFKSGETRENNNKESRNCNTDKGRTDIKKAQKLRQRTTLNRDFWIYGKTIVSVIVERKRKHRRERERERER